MNLDPKGRCCGRKPLFYKRGRGHGRNEPHYFCARCSREFNPDGSQRENWHWKESVPGMFEKRRKYGLKITAPERVFEDQLPVDMTDDDYKEWFKYSKVDGVRIGPVPFLLEAQEAMR